MTGDLDGNDVQSGYEFVNLRTGLRGDNWMVMLYGRNIGDELVASGALMCRWLEARISSTAHVARSGVCRRPGNFKLG